MLQAYTAKYDIAGEGNIPFNDVDIVGGTVTATSGGTEISLNAHGIYYVAFNATGSTTAAGTFGFQMYRDGSAVIQAQAETDTGAGEEGAVSFSTLMSVSRRCCCQSGVTLAFAYTGSAGTINLANVVITKVR